MDSGIYQLEFDDGATYIGKSVNIENRWNDHIKAFKSGKAAAKMQERYDKYGLPDFSVIYPCHKDHIDILENYLIQYYKPELNTVVAEAIDDEDFRILAENEELLSMSTVDHIVAIYDLMLDNKELHEVVEALDLEIKRLQGEESLKLAELEVGLDLEYTKKRLDETEEELIGVYKELGNALAELNKPWWKKLLGM
jgi:excinuclease UvrABC nuclease subunit